MIKNLFVFLVNSLLHLFDSVLTTEHSKKDFLTYCNYWISVKLNLIKKNKIKIFIDYRLVISTIDDLVLFDIY